MSTPLSAHLYTSEREVYEADYRRRQDEAAERLPERMEVDLAAGEASFHNQYDAACFAEWIQHRYGVKPRDGNVLHIGECANGRWEVQFSIVGEP